jgi:protein SCO1/2
MGNKKHWFSALLALCLLTLVEVAGAQSPQTGMAAHPGDPTSAKPGVLGRIGIDQRLNSQVPLDLPFVDESGQTVRLGDFFGKRPVILALVYYECRCSARRC